MTTPQRQARESLADIDADLENTYARGLDRHGQLVMLDEVAGELIHAPDYHDPLLDSDEGLEAYEDFVSDLAVDMEADGFTATGFHDPLDSNVQIHREALTAEMGSLRDQAQNLAGRLNEHVASSAVDVGIAEDVLDRQAENLARARSGELASPNSDSELMDSVVIDSLRGDGTGPVTETLDFIAVSVREASLGNGLAVEPPGTPQRTDPGEFHLRHSPDGTGIVVDHPDAGDSGLDGNIGTVVSPRGIALIHAAGEAGEAEVFNPDDVVAAQPAVEQAGFTSPFAHSITDNLDTVGQEHSVQQDTASESTHPAPSPDSGPTT